MTNIPNSVKFIVTLVLIAIIAGAFWITKLQPQLTAKTQAIQRLEDAQRDIEKGKKLKKEYEELVALYEKKKKEFEERKTQLFKGEVGLTERQFTHTFISQIQKLAEEVSAEKNDPTFKITTIGPGVPKRDSGAPKAPPPAATPAKGKAPVAPPVTAALAVKQTIFPFTLSMEGQYSTLIYFIQKLRYNFPKIVTIDNINISAKKTKDYSTLSITLPVKAYFFGEGGGK